MMYRCGVGMGVGVAGLVAMAGGAQHVAVGGDGNYTGTSPVYKRFRLI